MKSWLSGYPKSWFRHDLLAGVSVAAVALPIAIAYSQLAGVPPVYGLYASLLPLVAYALARLVPPVDHRARRRHLRHRRGRRGPAGGPGSGAVPVADGGAGHDRRRLLHRGRPGAPGISHQFPGPAHPDRLPQRHRHLHHHRPARHAVRIPARRPPGSFACCGSSSRSWAKPTGRRSRSARRRWPCCCCSRAWRPRCPGRWSPWRSASPARRPSAWPSTA